jgi:phosphatidylglycerol:prolipoprotein diacylglycerol transferase
MHPVLFTIGSYPVQAYPLFLTIGYFAALFLARKLAQIRGYAPAVFTDIGFIALVLGLIGARALFVLTNFSYFGAHPIEAPAFWGGGLVFFGGFLVALPGVVAYLQWKKISVPAAFDVLAPALALGHAIGRIGCFFAGCCHGSYCELPWAVRMGSPLVESTLRGLPIHPTQLYECFGLLLLVGLLLMLFRKKLAAGIVAASYLVGYSILRFGVEFFRGDTIRGTLTGTPFSTSQIVAAFLFLGGSGWLFARAFRSNH